MEFLQSHLLWILFIIIIILIASFLIKKAVKIALFLVSAALILIFLFDVQPSKIFDMTKDTADKTHEVYQKTLKPVIDKELEHATYTLAPDNTYTIKTESLKIKGILGENKASVYYKEEKFMIDVTPLEEMLAKIENESKQSSK